MTDRNNAIRSRAHSDAVLPILYSFRRCPYAMRARWALLEAGLLVQWREIALKQKPAEMLQVPPRAPCRCWC